MSKRIVVVLAAAAVFLTVAIAGSRRAEACEGPKGLDGMEEVILIGAAVITTDIIMTGYDLYKAGQGERPGRGYGLFETLVATPQLILMVELMDDASGDDKVTVYVFTAWMALLAGHGIYTLVAPEERPLPSPMVTIDVGKDAKMSFMPTMVSDGKETGGGLGAVLQW